MNPLTIFSQSEYENAVFSDLNLDGEEVVGKVFEHCTFTRSTFSGTELLNCSFISCSFKFCNLSSVRIVQSSFRDVLFEETKIMGVNWTKAKRPRVKLANMINFRKSNVSYSSFLGLDVRGIVMEECQAHEVDFREANLAGGNFCATDFKGSLFSRTNLNSANFIDAMNYSINPMENDIRKGKFSLPDAITLLSYFEIQVQ